MEQELENELNKTRAISELKTIKEKVIDNKLNAKVL